MIKGKLIPRRLKRSRPAMRWPGLERGSSSRILATWPAPDPHQAAARAAQLPGSKADRSPGPAAAATGPGSHQSAAAGPGGPLLQLLPSGAAAPDPHQAAARAAQLPGSEAGRSPGPGAAATGPGSRQGPGAVPSWAPAAAAPLRPGRAGSSRPGRAAAHRGAAARMIEKVVFQRVKGCFSACKRLLFSV